MPVFTEAGGCAHVQVGVFVLWRLARKCKMRLPACHVDGGAGCAYDAVGPSRLGSGVAERDACQHSAHDHAVHSLAHRLEVHRGLRAPVPR